MRILVLIGALILSCWAGAQEQSLGDVARSNQKKTANTERKSKRVITNEDPGFEESSDATADKSKEVRSGMEVPELSRNQRLTPEQEKKVKESLIALKSTLDAMEREATDLRKNADQKAEVLKNAKGSGLCYAQRQANEATTCEVIEAEQQRLRALDRNIQAVKSKLSVAQEKLRALGYGSSVYDP